MQKMASVLILTLFLSMIPVAFARYPTGGYDFNITNVSLSSTSLVRGTTLTVTTTIKNVGTLLGSVRVYLGIKQPDGSKIYPSSGTIYDIAVSSSKSIALTWNIPTSAQTGTHYADIDVYNTPETWLFDTTGFVYSFQVTPVQHDPVATCYSPASSNIQLTKGTSQTFTAYVTDQDGDLNYVEYYLGGVYQGRGTSVSGSSGYSSWSYTFSTYGSFLVKAIVYDSRNDPTHVGSCQWTVNVGYDPTISRYSPSQSSITIIQGNSQTFTANTNDLDGDLYIVEWYLQVQFQTTSSVSGYSAFASWSHSFPSSGTFTVAAIVYDSRYSSSHCATTSWTVTVNPDDDPVASCGSPSTSNFQIPVGTSQTFVAHVTDADGDLNYVDYYLNNVYVGRGSSVSGFSGDSSWSHTFSGYGTFLVEAEVYDDRNDPAHYGYCSWSVTVGYDPVASISSPSTANFNLPYGALQTFVAHVTDSDGDLNYVEYYLNGVYVERGSSVSGFSGDSSWAHIFNSSGTFTVEAVVYDSRNSGSHVGKCQWTVTVGSPPSWPVNLWSYYWKPELNPSDIVPRDYSYVSVSGSQLSMNLPKKTALRNKIYLNESEQFEAVYATITVQFKILNPQPQPNYAIFLYSSDGLQELDWEFSSAGLQQVTYYYNSKVGTTVNLYMPWNLITSYSDWTTLQFQLRPNAVYVYINGSPATDPIALNSPTHGFTTKNMALYFETSQGTPFTPLVASDFTSLIINSVTIYTDTTPPSTPVPDDGVSGWSNNNALTFTWSSSSDLESGAAGYYWKVDSGPETWTTTTSVSLPSQLDGTHTFYVRAQDNAGNCGAYGSHVFWIDTVAPVTGIVHFSGSSSVSLIASDATSGVSASYYRIDGGSWNTYSTPFTLSSGNTHTVDAYSTDNAGNTGPTVKLVVYYMTMSANYGSVNPGSGFYDSGSSITLSAAVSAGDGENYIWNGWTGTGAGSYTGMNNPDTITIGGPITETASWTHEYRLTISCSPPEGGYAIPTGTQWYNEGESPSITAHQNNGYNFDHWLLDSNNAGSSNPIVVVMNGPHALTACFATGGPYNINFYTSPSSIGSITFSGTTYTNGQSGQYAAGSYSVSANAPAGWSFDHWVTTGVVSISGSTATVLGAGTITAVFTQIFDFSVKASPSTRIVCAGSSTTYTATATLLIGSTQSVSWSVSGLPAGATCSFTPPSGNPTFSSTLKITTNSSLTMPGTYSITINGTGPYGSHTTTVTLSVFNFTVSSSLISPNGDGTLDNTTLKAYFWASVAWTLTVKNSSGAIVRHLASGTGLSLTTLWDGKDDSNNTVPDGKYTVVLNVPGSTKSLTVTVDDTPPTVTCFWNPNPFNPHTGQNSTLTYKLSEKCSVSIAIYDSSGNLVKTLLKPTFKGTGTYTIAWKGRNDKGAIVPAGTYTCRVYATDMVGNKVSPMGYVTCTVTVQ